MDGWCFLSEIRRFSIRTMYNHPMDPVILDMFQTIDLSKKNTQKTSDFSPRKNRPTKQTNPKFGPLP